MTLVCIDDKGITYEEVQKYSHKGRHAKDEKKRFFTESVESTEKDISILFLLVKFCIYCKPIEKNFYFIS